MAAEIALKVMLPGHAANPQAHKRFLRECRAAAGLEHDHIVHINHVGEDRGMLFLAMPLLAGETLAALFSREKRLPVAEAVRHWPRDRRGPRRRTQHG